jgi:hypothetical protein
MAMHPPDSDPRPRWVSRLARRAARSGWLAAAAAMLLVPAALGAQATQRAYQVELLVFSQPAGSSSKQPPRPRSGAQEPETGAFVLLPDAAAERLAAGSGEAVEDSALRVPPGFGPPVAPLSLADVASRLARNGFPTLWHQAWIQGPGAREGAGLEALAALGQGRAEPGLSGTVNLAVGRFLHLELALELDTPAGIEAELRQRRRMRLGVEHYFDHPRIGVIAVVTAVERPVAQLPGAVGP